VGANGEWGRDREVVDVGALSASFPSTLQTAGSVTDLGDKGSPVPHGHEGWEGASDSSPGSSVSEGSWAPLTASSLVLQRKSRYSF
jgi:hypothetical protein